MGIEHWSIVVFFVASAGILTVIGWMIAHTHRRSPERQKTG